MSTLNFVANVVPLTIDDYTSRLKRPKMNANDMSAVNAFLDCNLAKAKAELEQFEVNIINAGVWHEIPVTVTIQQKLPYLSTHAVHHLREAVSETFVVRTVTGAEKHALCGMEEIIKDFLDRVYQLRVTAQLTEVHKYESCKFRWHAVRRSFFELQHVMGAFEQRLKSTSSWARRCVNGDAYIDDEYLERIRQQYAPDDIGLSGPSLERKGPAC